MSELLSTKPYLVRAIHEWCIDNGLTPHLLVAVNSQTRVPVAYVKDGEIVLNLNYTATKDLQIGADAVTFSARFSGVSNNLYVPMSAVRGIYARENGQGMFFEIDPVEEAGAEASGSVSENATDGADKEKKQSAAKKPSLKLVK
ncbi:MAG: ClpXP protease specificity-enhancing factor [Microcystis aeruginosa Ma_MB_F_20061100_S19]|nr:MAG: ClpXP protease specificity-enhancing factor [Microcystis aeruginosa Ma_MB_F_20061100_S19]